MPPQAPTNAIDANRSVMNPVDMAAMAQNGTVKSDMTVRDLIEKVFKIPIDAPVSALVEAIKRQQQNQTGIGKAQAMATPVGSAMGPRNGTGPNGSMANSMPPQGGQPMPSKQGISDLMGGR